MARYIGCDEPGCGFDAAFMLSDLGDGSVTALCAEHWIGYIRAMADALAQVEFREIPKEEESYGPEAIAALPFGPEAGVPDHLLPSAAAIEAAYAAEGVSLDGPAEEDAEPEPEPEPEPIRRRRGRHD